MKDAFFVFFSSSTEMNKQTGCLDFNMNQDLDAYIGESEPKTCRNKIYDLCIFFKWKMWFFLKENKICWNETYNLDT